MGTEDGVAKFKQDVDDLHTAFKDHVKSARPSLDIEEIATGEVWFGTAALQRGLVDKLGTSDEEIKLKVAEGFRAIEITPHEKKKQGFAKFMESFSGGGAADVAEAVAVRVGDIARVT